MANLKENLAYLLSKDDWKAVELMDHWVTVYSWMPPKMRLIVDLKSDGMSNKDISKLMGISVTSICNHLLKAKKRILRGENIL